MTTEKQTPEIVDLIIYMSDKIKMLYEKQDRQDTFEARQKMGKKICVWENLFDVVNNYTSLEQLTTVLELKIDGGWEL